MNIEERLVELESRIAFQDDTIQALNDALADAQMALSKQQLVLKRIVEELKSARGAGVTIDAADEPPPPHY
ncbi:SlyX family protein [Lysobacter sp. HDW10]|uniref:SlyX family protein n=1 Tax=Lysobacter sp. HDW10 TaxID=2714936 RepID=UPI00140D806A|nr:SlyX family protein [Lysobacter sp. HDW10]QIK81533.1 SlyX family protein [Lysobacter sp. HDW10]